MTTYLPPKNDAGSDVISAVRQHAREIASSVRNIIQGRLNCVFSTFTLTAGAATTVLTDARLTQSGVVFFDPLTANAAAELAAGTLYVLLANRNDGAWTVTHANAVSVDRSYRVLILG